VKWDETSGRSEDNDEVRIYMVGSDKESHGQSKEHPNFQTSRYLTFNCNFGYLTVFSKLPLGGKVI
jgi:hypothetical protein